ncbi:hypothetical protein ACHAXT_005306 [Thalassiosira profunda]
MQANDDNDRGEAHRIPADCSASDNDYAGNDAPSERDDGGGNRGANPGGAESEGREEGEDVNVYVGEGAAFQDMHNPNLMQPSNNGPQFLPPYEPNQPNFDPSLGGNAPYGPTNNMPPFQYGVPPSAMPPMLPQPPSLPPTFGGNPTHLDATRQYYEARMREHAMQYANAAAGAAWAAARIACGDPGVGAPGNRGMHGYAPNNSAPSYYTPASAPSANNGALVAHSAMHSDQVGTGPRQKRTLWQPPSSPGKKNGAKVPKKGDRSGDQSGGRTLGNDKKRPKKRESANDSVSSLGSESRDLSVGRKGVGPKQPGKKSNQRRRFNEDASPGNNNAGRESAKQGGGVTLKGDGRNPRQKRGLHHGHSSRSSLSSLGSNPHPSGGRNKKKNRSQKNEPQSVHLGGLIGKNGARALHELCTKYRWEMPKYTSVEQEAAASAGNEGNNGTTLLFVLAVEVNGVELGRGRGSTKAAAKQDASRKAFAALVPGAVFDPNGILLDVGSELLRGGLKSLSLDDLGPHLASHLAIGGARERSLSPDHSEDASSISTKDAVSLSRAAEEVISGGPLSAGRAFSSNIYPCASTTSGVSSASELDDADENAYYSSRGASASDAKESASSKRKKVEPPSRDVTVPRMFQCNATLTLYFSKELVGDKDPSSLMDCWETPLDYLQSKKSASTATGTGECVQSRKRKDSFATEATTSPEKSDGVEEPDKSPDERKPPAKEEFVKHKLGSIGIGSTKRESKHKASAKLLAALFPSCNSIVEAKAEAEAARELYASSKAAGQAKRLKLTTSSPERKGPSKRFAHSHTKSDIPLHALSLSDTRGEAKRLKWSTSEADDLESIVALLEKGETSPTRLSKKKRADDPPGESPNAKAAPESDNVDENSAEEGVDDELNEVHKIVLVLTRAVALDPPLGCAILTLETSSKDERVLSLSKMGHEEHIPRERFRGAGEEPDPDDATDPADDPGCGIEVELVLATKESTKGVGWLITDGEHANDVECSIPFYDTVKEGGNLEEADWKDQPVVRQAKIGWRDDLTISWMERHMEMTQGFMLVGKAPGLMLLGEPTHDRDDLSEERRRWPDFRRVKGYIIPPGCGIIIRKGVWHDFPLSVGPELSVFIINTKEVVEALMSMKEPAPMDFGDCYKVRLADCCPRGREVRFPDPRPFVESLGFFDGSTATKLRKSESSITSASTWSHESQSTETSKSDVALEYGQGMTRTEVGQWGGADANKVWLVPVVNVESFDPDKFGPSVQPHLNTSQPELANRGWRDYGNRQGLKRLGILFGQHDIPCTAVVSSDLADNAEVMTLLRQFKSENRWEIGAHGTNNSTGGHAGLTEAEEASKISASLDRLGAAFQCDGPKTWLTPGFSVTNSTPKLLAEAGVETLLDFVDDDVPFNLTREGPNAVSPSDPLICLPYSMETNDFSLVLTRHLSPREYAAALESHIRQLAKEARDSGSPRVVCLGMHTFVAGGPASVYELDKVLERLKSDDGIKWATAREATESVRRSEAPSPELCIQTKPSGGIQLDPQRFGLILIDLQNDFLCRGGFGEQLGNDPSKLRQIIQPTREVLASFRKAGLPVIHTREGHRSNLSDLTSLKAGSGQLIGSEGQHGRSMVRGQWGNEIISELAPRESETVIDKPGKGAFYQTDLELVLRNAEIDTLIVCGVTTEVCVHSTVREANDRGIRCIVLEDCTASYFEEFHACGIRMISAQGGILGKVSDSKSIIRGLEMYYYGPD